MGFVNTESNIDNANAISVDQKPLLKTFHCPATPDDEDLVDCLWRLMV